MKRETVIKVRVNQGERLRLDQAAKKAGVSRARYMREISLNPQVDMFAAEAKAALLREMAKIGNNLNQVARKINNLEWGPSERIEIINALRSISSDLEVVHDR